MYFTTTYIYIYTQTTHQIPNLAWLYCIAKRPILCSQFGVSIIKNWCLTDIRNSLSLHLPAVGADHSDTFINFYKLHNILIVFFFLRCVMKQRVLHLSRSPQKRSCWEFTQTLNGHLTPFSIKSHRFYSHVLLINSQGWLQLQNLMIQPLEMMNYLLDQSLLWSYKNVLGWGIGPQIIINEGQQHSGNFPVCSITTCLESNFSIKGELNM